MSYGEAFEAAGAVVHGQEWFGSYQGDALFDVEFEGKRGVLCLSYGSCSGCDNFEATFGYRDGETCDEHRYAYPQPTDCPDCAKAAEDFKARLAEFGRSYLDGIVEPGTEAWAKYRAELVEQTEWDFDAKAQLAWLDAHGTSA